MSAVTTADNAVRGIGKSLPSAGLLGILGRGTPLYDGYPSDPMKGDPFVVWVSYYFSRPVRDRERHFLKNTV